MMMVVLRDCLSGCYTVIYFGLARSVETGLTDTGYRRGYYRIS